MPYSLSSSAIWLSLTQLVRVLGRDQLPDQRAHRRARRLPPASVPRLEPKKYFELVGAERRRHVLGAGDAADGRFVQAQLVGDLGLHQRPHRELANRRKKLRWRSTMAAETRRMVSKRCWMFLMNQRASLQSLLQALRRSPCARAGRAGIDILHAQAGMTSGLSSTLKPSPGALTMTSGTTMLRWTSAKRRPGGLEPRDQRQRLAREDLVGHCAASFLTSRLASSSSGLLADRERGARRRAVAQLEDLQAQAFG